MKQLFLAIIISALPAFSAPREVEENVVVTANAYPVPFENLSRTVTVITRDEIGKLPVQSLADLIGHAVSADVVARAPLGIQADLRLRGSAFSQVLVMVDGIRINNSQTGHHNADFPVQLHDVERVEVLLGAGSSLYGADAFGGIVNIITRRDKAPASAAISGGQHGLVNGSFAAGFSRGDYVQSINVSGNRSTGFRSDRDFRSAAVSTRFSYGDRIRFLISHVNKEFGAAGFYGPSPSREWTNQTMISFQSGYEGTAGGNADFHGFYRTHGDRFLYDVRTPGIYENNHRTHAAGVTVKTRFRVASPVMLTVGSEAGGDWIASNNLGNHAIGRTSLFSEAHWQLGEAATLYPGIRFDYYTSFGHAVNPSLSGSWWLMQRVRLRASAGRAFRIPVFTERYYRDPNHEADASLRPESAWSFDLGADIMPADDWIWSMTLFARKESDVIDWTRSSPEEKWKTRNIRNIASNGAEITVTRSFGADIRVRTGYSIISMDAGDVDYLSKYVLDFARHSWTSSVYVPLPFALSYRQSLSYKKRSGGRDYWLLDNSLERRFRHFSASVDISNLLDRRYQEIAGIDMPGRWITFGLHFR